MDDKQPAQEPESEQDSSPPWLGWYRRYLYFALILSAFGVVLSFTVWGGSFLGAVLDVVVAAIILKSLNRFGEKLIKILHLAVNGVTLLTAMLAAYIALMNTPRDFSGDLDWFLRFLLFSNDVIPYQMLLSIQSFLTVLAVDFGVLSMLVWPTLIILVFALISVYWLVKWYQVAPTSDDDQTIGDEEAPRSTGHSKAPSNTNS